MMKNAVIVLLALSVVGLGAYVVGLKRDMAEVRKRRLEEAVDVPAREPERVTRRKVAAPPSADPGPADPAPAKPVDSKARAQLEKANKLITALYRQNEALEKDNAPSFAKGFAQMMESPEFQDMTRQRIERGLERSHGRLFRWLELDEEQAGELKALLIERSMAEMANGANWMSGKFDEAAENIVAAREEMYKEVEDLLGADALDVYKYWDASKNERESVQRFNRSLSDDQKLDDERSDKLVAMMYEERGQFEELDHLSQPENFDPREMNAERLDDVMTQVEGLHKVFVKKADPILAPEVLPKYESNLATQRQRLRGFIEFSHRMATRASGGGGTEGSTPQQVPDAIGVR